VFRSTHIAENKGRIAWVKKLFPWRRDYLDVYDQYGLNRTVVAVFAKKPWHQTEQRYTLPLPRDRQRAHPNKKIHSPTNPTVK